MRFLTLGMWMVLMSVSGGARADMRATYVVPQSVSFEVVFEISDAGAIRIGQEERDYYLILKDAAYLVEAGPGGPIVLSLEAAAYRHRWYWGDAGTPENDPPETQRLEPRGQREIAGYPGLSYSVAGEDEDRFVLTEDPALKPLGPAYLAYLAALDRINGHDSGNFANLEDLLAERGLLSDGWQELRTVETGPIARDRFEIPAEPMTVEDMQAQLGPIPDDGDEPRGPVVMEAAYLDGVLYTLMSDGKVLAWPEGADRGEVAEVPGNVLGLCSIGAGLYWVSLADDETTVTVFSGRPGELKEVGATAVPGLGKALRTLYVAVVNLDCSADVPLVLLPGHLWWPSDGRKMRHLRAVGMGYSVTLQHGGYLYHGFNTGEFGGGLSRMPLAGGRLDRFAAFEEEDWRRGALRSETDPITGVQPDPGHEDCVLVSVGLAHFMTSGKIVRVCGETQSLVYAKPVTLKPDWRFDPDNIKVSYPSVAFFSMARGENAVWAVGQDGVYRFDGGAAPDFTAFPTTWRVPESGIDWSHPDFVLVFTDKAAAFSVGGGALLLVLR